MNRLLTIPLRAPRLTLAVMLVLTAFFGYFARSIRVDSSIENLLPADDPSKSYYDEVKKVFGDEEIAVVGVFADNIFTPSTLAKIDRLTERLSQLEGVREVISPTNVQGIEVGYLGLDVGRVMRELPRTPEAAAAVGAKLLANPIYVKNVVSPDGTAAGLSIVFDDMTDDEFLQRAYDEQIRSLVAAEIQGPERWAVTGIPTIKANGARLMESDVVRFTPLSMLLVIAVLAWAFRTPRGVLVPLSTVVIGVVWTTGLMVLMGTAITMGTLVLNPLLMVVGVASGIHLISEYYIEFRPGRSSVDIVRHTLDKVAGPVLVAAATTLIGFGTLIFTPIRAVREFGIYSVFGIVAIVVAAFTVVPALLVLLPLPKHVGARQVDGGWLPTLLRRIAGFSVRHRKTVLACSLLFMALSLWGISRIRIETDYISFFDPDSFVRIDNRLIGERLAGTQPIYVVVDGDGPGAVTRLEVLAAMRDLQAFIDKQPGADKTMSLLDYLAIVRKALQPEAEGSFPETQSEVEQIFLLVNPADIAAVVNRDASRANIIVRTSLSGSVEVGRFVDRVQEFANSRFPRGIRVHPTGTVVLLSQSADMLAWGQVTGLWQELAVLLALLSFMFLSVRVGIMALIPNVYPTFILFGIMGWSGITLNVSTSMIAAIAIGIAIDDTIHLLSSFNAELRKTGSQSQAILNSMASVGQAAFFIALALSAGFFIVCLSNFQPVRHFGLLSGVTMGVAVVVEFFLTPALVTTTKIVTLWDLLQLKLGPEPHKQIPLFQGLRPFQAKLVVLMGRLESVRHGTLITRRGELKAEMYVILSGRGNVQRDDGPVIRSLGRGDVIGEMGLVRQRPRSADVVAVEDTEYLVLDARFLQRLRRQYPRIASTVFWNLSRILSDRLESTTDALSTPPLVPLSSVRGATTAAG